MPEPWRDGWRVAADLKAASRNRRGTSDVAPTQPLLDLVYCEKCLHHAPMALVPLKIRWDADTSSDRLLQRARCTKCSHKGATLQHPGWAARI